MLAAISIDSSAIRRAGISCVARQRLGRRHRIGPTRSYRDDAIVRLDEIAVARKQVRRLGVHHDEHGLEPAKHAIGAPVLGQLHGRSLEVAAILFELGLEAREQGKRIRRRTGKSGQDAIVVEPASLAGVLLDDGVTERDLTVAGHDGLVAMTDGQDSGGVKHRLIGVYQRLRAQGSGAGAGSSRLAVADFGVGAEAAADSHARAASPSRALYQ